MTLRLASFGVRGFVGQSLTPRVAMDFAAAFGTFVDGGRVLLGRDTRYSSPMLHSAVTASLLSCGCDVLDFGICPTPVLQFSVKPYEAAGALSITGGHNEMGWNALTLLGADGAFLEPTSGEALLGAFHAVDFVKRDAMSIGRRIVQSDYFAPYLRALAKVVNRVAICRANFTVLIDPVGGAGCAFLDAFSQAFNLNLVAINGEPSGYLARDPEPRPRTARQMASFIRHVKGHAGFVLSSDMGRLSLVAETGEPLSEEYTLPLIVRHLLRQRAGPVVTNSCTSRMVDDIAAGAGVELIKTEVGQAYVVAKMADEQARVGGEGSGSAAVPEFSRGFDGFLMMALVLEQMALSGEPLSALVRSLPSYQMVKKSIKSTSRAAYRVLELFHAEADRFGADRIDLTDGVRLDWEDGWLHVRASHTEQLIRVLSEARSREAAERRADEALRMIGQEL